MNEGKAWLLAGLILEAISSYGVLGASIVHADERIIPSVTVSERYDSNVFNAASQFVPAGVKQWDFVTSVTPTLLVTFPERQAKTELRASASGNTMVNNPELSFITTDVTLGSNLNGLVGEFIPGAKLSVSDYFQFTPEPPGFLTGVKAGTVPDLYARGLQVARANTIQNSARATGQVPLSRAVNLTGEYIYSFFKIGTIYISQDPGAPVASLTTETRSASGGLNMQIARSQALSVTYRNTQTNFSGVGAGETGSTVSAASQDVSFATHAIQAGYSIGTRDWTLNLSVGSTLIEPGFRSYLAGSVQVETRYSPTTSVAVSLSRDTAPSLFGTVGALISTTVGLIVQHKFERGVKLNATVNYAYNETAPVAINTYESLAGQVSVTYPVTRTLSSSLQYNYSRFVLATVGGGAAGNYQVNRNALMFSLSYTFNE